VAIASIAAHRGQFAKNWGNLLAFATSARGWKGYSSGEKAKVRRPWGKRIQGGGVRNAQSSVATSYRAFHTSRRHAAGCDQGQSYTLYLLVLRGGTRLAC
jgi:hypothetical protein